MSCHYKNIIISEELKPFFITIIKRLLELNKKISLKDKNPSIRYDKDIIYKKIKDTLFNLKNDTEIFLKLDLEDLKNNLNQSNNIDIEQLKFFNKITCEQEKKIYL